MYVYFKSVFPNVFVTNFIFVKYIISYIQNISSEVFKLILTDKHSSLFIHYIRFQLLSDSKFCNTQFLCLLFTIQNFE